MGLLTLVCSLTWLAVVAVLIFRAARQRDQLRRLSANEPPRANDAPIVAVIIPARDEAKNIGACLRGLLGQDYPPDRYEIVVVDDQSADATPDIVAALCGDHPRLKLLRSPPLPRGWMGKSQACWLGACAVAPPAEWLCFIDADMRAGRKLIASAVQAARAGRLDLLSLTPRHELISFAERLVIPCGLFLLAFLQDLGALQSADSGDASATGQFMLIRSSTYAAIGGHAAVRTAICEDLELARRCKRSGFSVLIQDGAPLLSGRMYTGWRTLWPGFAKNVVDMLRGARATAVTAIAAVILAWATLIVPALAVTAYAHDPGVWPLAALACALAASAAICALHVGGAIHFAIPFWYGLLFPVGYTACAMIAADSIRRRRHAGVVWKGRVYS
jgi:chlorobactene glucosyltransferase